MSHARAGQPVLRHKKPPLFFIRWKKFLKEHPEYERSVNQAQLIGELMFRIARSYFDLEVRGIKNIPYGKRFVWTHNHSGWIAFDALLIASLIARHNRVQRFHRSFDQVKWFSLLTQFFPEMGEIGDWGVCFWNNTAMRAPLFGRLLKMLHGLPVSQLKKPKALKDYSIFVTPAEGEEGSCKSSFSELYHLKKFHTGVARLAFENKLDYIVPTMIIGPEESFPGLGPIRFLHKKIGTILPLPLPVPPIPVKWVVSFLPPIDIRKYRPEYRRARTVQKKRELYERVMDSVKRKIGDEIRGELCHRKPFQPWPLNGRGGSNIDILLGALEKNENHRNGHYL